MAWLRDANRRLFRDAMRRAVLASCPGGCCGCVCPDGTPRMPCCCLEPDHPDYCGDNAELCDCACVCPNGGGLLSRECCDGTWAPTDPRCNCDENEACCAAGAVAYFDRRFPRTATLTITGSGSSYDCRSCSCSGGTADAPNVVEAWRFSGLTLSLQITLPASSSGNGCGDSEGASAPNQSVGVGTDYTFPRILPCSGVAHDCGATTVAAAFGQVFGSAELGPGGLCTAAGGLSVGGFGTSISSSAITHSLPIVNAQGSCAGAVNGADISVPGGGCAGRVNTGQTQCTSTASPFPTCVGDPAGDASLSAASAFFPVKFCPGARLAAPRDRAPIIRPIRRFHASAHRRRGSIIVPGIIVPGCATCGRDGRTGGGSTL